MRLVAKPDTLPVVITEGRRLPPSTPPTFDDDPLFKQVSDPACSPEVLRATLEFVHRMPGDQFTYRLGLLRAIRRNPNLSEDDLHGMLTDGYEDAWLNPAVGMHLLTHPMVPGSDMEGGLCRAATGEYGGGGPDVDILRLCSRWHQIRTREDEFMTRWRPTLYAIVARER